MNGSANIFLYLPGSVRKLERLGKSAVYSKKHMLLEAEQLSEYCYVVKNGRIVSYEIYPNGEKRIYHVYEKGSVLLEENVLFGQLSFCSYRTECTTEVICIDKNSLLKAICSDPALAMDMIEASSAKFHSTMEKLRYTKFYSSTWKVCDLLISMAEYYGVPYGNYVLIKEKISQQVISDMLGLNRITTVRVIKELKNRDILEIIKGYYCVKDMEKLSRYREEAGIQ